MDTAVAAVRKPRIKKGDTVYVIGGRAKGRRGKVLSVDRFTNRITVEKVNLIKRHTKPTRQSKGGIIERESPLHLSSVMLVCPVCDKPTRVAIRRLNDGRRLRMCKKCDEVIEKGKSS